MGRATEAKEKTEEAERKEAETLTDYEGIIDEYAGDTTGGGASLTDTEDTKPVSAMPSGATVIEADPSKGIVIKDSKNNEWVWIEVPKTTVFKTATASNQYDNIETDLIAYAGEDYRGNWTDEWCDYYGTTYDGTNEYSQIEYITSSTKFNNAKTYYGTIYADNAGTAEATSYVKGTTYYAKITEKITDTSVCGLTYDEYQSTYQAMLSSVYTNGGFWIGRYEAGVSDNTCKMNIYDFAGNEYEMTLEKTSHFDMPCALRGGSCSEYSSSFPAAGRGYTSTSNSFYDISFRPSLY